MNERPNRRPRYGRRIVVAALCIIAVAVGAAFVPWPVGGFPSHPQPVESYEEAVRRAQDFDGERASLMSPICRSRLLTHGQKTEHVIVFVHGYENCPEEFGALGTRFHDLGYNVLIATLPAHGLADRMTDAISYITAAQLAAYADETIDIAQGLGNRVNMVGLSAGGTVTAWAAQNRSDLNLAVMMAPPFGFREIPTSITVPAMNVFSLLPESYRWIDSDLKTEFEPAWAYPRHSVHALAQLLRLSSSVRTAAHSASPAAGRVLVITNANDKSVNNELTRQAVASWQAHSLDVFTYEFPASLGLGHDLVDPHRPDQQIDLVYPIIIELFEKYK